MIAEQKTEHSWMLPVMKAAENWDWEQEEKAEDLLSHWIAEQTSQRNVARAIRMTLLYLLENKAITKLVEKRPDWTAWLPEILDPKEAVALAEREVPLSEEEKAETSSLRERMQEGSLRPSRELLGEAAQETR